MNTQGEQAMHHERKVKLNRSIGIDMALKIRVSRAEDQKPRDRFQDKFLLLLMTKNLAMQTAQY